MICWVSTELRKMNEAKRSLHPSLITRADLSATTLPWVPSAQAGRLWLRIDVFSMHVRLHIASSKAWHALRQVLGGRLFASGRISAWPPPPCLGAPLL